MYMYKRSLLHNRVLVLYFLVNLNTFTVGTLKVHQAGEIGRYSTRYELVRGWRDPSRVRTPLKLISFPPLSLLKYSKNDVTVTS